MLPIKSWFFWPMDIFKRLCSLGAPGIFVFCCKLLNLTWLSRGCCLPLIYCRHLWPIFIEFKTSTAEFLLVRSFSCICTKIWHVKGGCRSNKHHSYATIIVQVPPRLPPQLHNMCNSRIVIHTNRKQLVCLGRKLCSLHWVAEQCISTTLTERFAEREIGWPEVSEWDAAAHSGNPGQTIVSWHELCLHGS